MVALVTPSAQCSLLCSTLPALILLAKLERNMLHLKLIQWNSYRILVTEKSWELPGEDVKSNTEARTMNELRSEMYHKLKTKSHTNLPPTSQGIKPHIYWSLFCTHCIINSIQIIEGTCQMLNRLEWGFALDEDYIVPTYNWKCLKEDLTVVCDCKQCARSTCPC